ncbi:MAG TPA: hypothetical protein VJR89_31825, partial [Polyangiales bacterium]|nr:hypothetical protein [Polyangiales bacterium]
IINLIGLGLGPLLTGALSDLIGARFVIAGRAPAAASGEGLRWALAIMTLVNLWSAWHYARAARTLRADLTAS